MNYIDHMVAMFHWQLTLVNYPEDFIETCEIADRMCNDE